MFRNYLRISWRTLRRRPGQAAIHAFGLTIGIACCTLIFLFVRNEYAVNQLFDDADRIYRVDSEWSAPKMGLPFTTAAPVASTLVDQYPEVVDGVRLYLMNNRVRVSETSLRREVMMADATVLDLFGVPLSHGDPTTALTEPRSVVVTEALAETLFGTTDVLGRSIQFETWQNGEQPYTITGVRPTLPYNSLTYFGAEDWNYSLIISPQPYGDFFDESGWTSWDSRYILQYVKLDAAADASALRRKLDGFIETHAPAALHDDLRIHLNPLRTLYLTDHDGLNQRIVWLLSAVAGLILLIACINFINLSTARSLTRAREVGVRKTVGAHRGQLVLQFLSESTLLVAGATVAGVGFAAWSLEAFMALADKQLVLAQPWDATTAAALGGVALLTSVLAGFYPAVVLSGFKPVQALQGSLGTAPRTATLRNGLVVAQFALAVVLITSVYTVSQQVHFILNRDLGFDQSSILVINSVPRDFSEEGLSRLTAVKEYLARLPDVEAASLSWRTAAESMGGRATHPPSWSPDDALSVQVALTDADFLDTYGLTLAEGRFFDDDRPADTAGVVINERAAAAFGWHDGIDGKELVIWNMAQPAADATPPEPQPVIGLAEDHHFESLHEPIRPLVFLSVRAEPMWRVIGLRLAGTDLSATLDEVAQAWSTVLPHVPFDYTFLDDQVAQMYQTEQQLLQVLRLAAVLAVLIACLGMLGLATHRVAQRTKEIGIRKVLGASVLHILGLLSRDFLRPVLLAVLLAVPVSYLLLRAWLTDFAYRIDLSSGLFLAAGVTALLAAALAVSTQSIRAATMDPTESLRYE